MIAGLAITPISVHKDTAVLRRRSSWIPSTPFKIDLSMSALVDQPHSHSVSRPMYPGSCSTQPMERCHQRIQSNVCISLCPTGTLSKRGIPMQVLRSPHRRRANLIFLYLSSSLPIILCPAWRLVSVVRSFCIHSGLSV